MITLDRPPLTEKRKEWADWLNKVYLMITSTQTPVLSDSTRGSAGQKGRVIFNTTDGKLNIDNGTNWTLPDGTVT